MPLPQGYTQVEYIQSSGTQYISTGFLPNNNTRVVADLQVVEVGESVALFGARAGASVTSYMAWQISATRFRSDFNDNYTNCNVDTVLNRIVVDKNKNVCSFGDSTVTTPYSTFQCENELKLFRGSSATSVTKGSSIKLYSCQVYDNGNLIRDYIPAIQINNGEAGLYDQLNNAFYANEGSGDFIAGPVVVVIPEAPQNFRAVSYTANSATLAWDAVENADGYILARDGIQIYEGAETRYTDTEISDGNTYTYSLLAYNTAGQSEPVTITLAIPVYTLDLITDRTADDVLYVKSLREKGWRKMTTDERTAYLSGLKGNYGYTDINRVTEAEIYIAGEFNSSEDGLHDYYNEAIQDILDSLDSDPDYYDLDDPLLPESMWQVSFGTVTLEDGKTDWQYGDIPSDYTDADNDIYDISYYLPNVNTLRGVLAVSLPPTPEDLDDLTFSEANDIESILLGVYDNLVLYINDKREAIDEAKENEIDKYKKMSAAWIYSGEVFCGEM